MTDKTSTGPQEAQGGPEGAQEAPGGELASRDGDRGAEAPVRRLARLRDQLAAEQAKAERADQAAASRPDLNDLRITPHNGIAAGLAIALFLVDHHLREAGALTPSGEWLTAGTRDQSIPDHDGGPTVRECAVDDRVHWGQRQWGGEPT
jgi:hypothetical protein